MSDKQRHPKLCSAIVSEASASLSTVGAALQAVAGRIAAMGIPTFAPDATEHAQICRFPFNVAQCQPLWAKLLSMPRADDYRDIAKEWPFSAREIEEAHAWIMEAHSVNPPAPEAPQASTSARAD